MFWRKGEDLIKSLVRKYGTDVHAEEGVSKCKFWRTREGASEWLRCKALRMRAPGVYWSTWPSPKTIATQQIGHYDTPSLGKHTILPICLLRLAPRNQQWSAFRLHLGLLHSDKKTTKKDITKPAFIKISVYLHRTIIAISLVVNMRRALSWQRTRQPTPGRVWPSRQDEAVWCGHWVGSIVQT